LAGWTPTTGNGISGAVVALSLAAVVTCGVLASKEPSRFTGSAVASAVAAACAIALLVMWLKIPQPYGPGSSIGGLLLMAALAVAAVAMVASPLMPPPSAEPEPRDPRDPRDPTAPTAPGSSPASKSETTLALLASAEQGDDSVDKGFAIMTLVLACLFGLPIVALLGALVVGWGAGLVRRAFGR